MYSNLLHSLARCQRSASELGGAAAGPAAVAEAAPGKAVAAARICEKHWLGCNLSLPERCSMPFSTTVALTSWWFGIVSYSQATSACCLEELRGKLKLLNYRQVPSSQSCNRGAMCVDLICLVVPLEPRHQATVTVLLKFFHPIGSERAEHEQEAVIKLYQSSASSRELSCRCPWICYGTRRGKLLQLANRSGIEQQDTIVNRQAERKRERVLGFRQKGKTPHSSAERQSRGANTGRNGCLRLCSVHAMMMFTDEMVPLPSSLLSNKFLGFVA